MAHCTQCGHTLSANDRFCGKCGTPRNGVRTGAQRPDQERRRRPEFVPALKTEAGQQAVTAINARKANAARLCAMICLGLAAAVAAGAFLFFGKERFIVAAVGGVVVTIGGLLAAGTFKHWSEEDYYEIPGSRDESGEHRCIHCGHRGIYRHGEYASSTKYADCSKCKENLWLE